MADVGGPASGTRTVWLGVVSLCLVQFVDVLGVTVMVTALPAMLSDLHASADYRRRAAATLAVRAITDAYRAAEGAHAG